MGVGGQHHAPAVLPLGKTRYPLYKRLGRPQGRSGRLRKISPPPGFDPRAVQPVASCYTDWTIPAHENNIYHYKMVHISPINSNRRMQSIERKAALLFTWKGWKTLQFIKASIIFITKDNWLKPCFSFSLWHTTRCLLHRSRSNPILLRSSKKQFS